MKWTKEKIIEELKNLEKRSGRRPTKRDDSNLYRLSRIYFGKWNNLMKEVGYETKDNQHPKLPEKNQKELYYFLGLMITDGHIVINKIRKTYQVKLYTSFEKEKELILSLIEKLFDYNPSVRKRETQFGKQENYEIYLSSKLVCEFLSNELGIPSGAKCLNVKVPQIITNSKNHQISAFLRGVIDGDGSVLKGNVIKIASGSKDFLEGIKVLLNKLGVHSGKICKETPNLNVLWVCGRDNVLKLRNFLYSDSESFFYPRKKESWNQYI